MGCNASSQTSYPCFSYRRLLRCLESAVQFGLASRKVALPPARLAVDRHPLPVSSSTASQSVLFSPNPALFSPSVRADIRQRFEPMAIVDAFIRPAAVADQADWPDGWKGPEKPSNAEAPNGLRPHVSWLQGPVRSSPTHRETHANPPTLPSWSEAGSKPTLASIGQPLRVGQCTGSYSLAPEGHHFPDRNTCRKRTRRRAFCCCPLLLLLIALSRFCGLSG